MRIRKAVRIFEQDDHVVHGFTVSNSDERRWVVHFNNVPGSPHVIIGKRNLVKEARALREEVELESARLHDLPEIKVAGVNSEHMDEVREMTEIEAAFHDYSNAMNRIHKSKSEVEKHQSWLDIAYRDLHEAIADKDKAQAKLKEFLSHSAFEALCGDSKAVKP